MKVIIIFFVLVSMSHLSAQNLNELKSFELTNDGVLLESTSSGVKFICNIGEQKTFTRIDYGSKILIPKNQSFRLSARHLTIIFDPLNDGGKYKVTKTRDSRSFGGELENETFALNFKDDGSYYVSPINDDEGNKIPSVIRKIEERKPKYFYVKGLEEDRIETTNLKYPSNKETISITAKKSEMLDKSSSRLPWIIAGVLLVGILALLFKIFKGKFTS